ncbi:ABC-type transport system involved in multi-copper enzyme maturation, permease component [Luteitalea pratensis]|uniref:ABC-type transport system involved in multi-copper enzyme maturation, permease component n=1 Tax=Luteitalea pratensis TaxID=1855912 RepID=A0A143PTR8_LUTPR|nr:ABC transporter permease subunit [Luteitalea pratensis]AMY11490.1 ABC-type transport system involved in multi-copper enzyme maturation, permease component [Luteitalea pratensis]
MNVTAEVTPGSDVAGKSVPVTRDPIPGTPASRGAASLSLWRASARIFDLSLDQMLWSRRTVFMALVVGGPLLIALAVRVIDMFAAQGGVQIDGVKVGSAAIFGLMVWVFYLRFAVPVLAVFYGTSLMADEVEDKTITYLFSRPIPRGAVLLGKYLAYLVCTVAVVLPSVVLVYLLIMSRPGASLAGGFMDLVKDLVVIVLGLAAYGAVFAWVGAQFKRPLLTGLAFVFAWEPAMLVIPGYLRRFSVAYYLQGLVPQAMPTDDSTASLLTSLFREFPTVGTSLFWLVLITATTLWLAMRTVTRREYVLEQ